MLAISIILNVLVAILIKGEIAETNFKNLILN